MASNREFLRSSNNIINDRKEGASLQEATRSRKTYFGSLFKGQRSSWWARHGDKGLRLVVVLQLQSESTKTESGVQALTQELPLMTQLLKGNKGSNIETCWRKSPFQPHQSQMAAQDSTSKSGPSLLGFYAPKFSTLDSGCVLLMTQTALPSKTKFPKVTLRGRAFPVP